MDSEGFSTNVQIFLDESSALGKRLRVLLSEVIQGLPAEEQFGMKGQISFCTRIDALRLWQVLGSNPFFGGHTPDLSRPNRDGNCTYTVGQTVDNSVYFITIIIDKLHAKSDSYIKGLIAHELAEMSYMFRLVQKEVPTLRKMGRKARQLRLAAIGKQNYAVGSREHEERENNVNQEAMRLGFSEEIRALETGN